jgi:DNA polymerase III subunit gamma/tau
MPTTTTADSPSFDSAPDQEPPRPYRVLARTYRPQRLSELIGQEALVRTLSNALHSGRVAHAFLLTGIRGVGKTTTARIIARALNCLGADGHGRPTPEPCGVCEPCITIAEGRHIDVLEMDAATRTGIDDIREIVDSVRYAPSSARYKVYIIDEVHMLSEKAFNGLLKTLEEPPPQTIFVFATTEVRKVPVTVLSRCQRFDLRRIEGDLLHRHLDQIAAKEQVRVEAAALALIVRAAEGSVRDGLSLLDQAIALAAADGATITAAQVQAMLGLADRSRVLDLFEHLARGAIADALAGIAELYDLGSEPEAVLQDLLEISHWLTRIKVVPEAADRFGVAEQDLARARALADGLSMPVLARIWQMLLRGLEDVRLAPSPLPAAEMVLVRVAYAADLPPPSQLVGQGAPAAPAVASASSAAAPPERSPPASEMPGSFAEAVALFERWDEPILHGWLYQAVRLVAYEPGRIDLRLAPGTPLDLPARVTSALERCTGRPWQVTVAGDDRPAAPTLAEEAAAARRAQLEALADDPRIKPVLQHYPGAAVVDVRPAASR